MDTNDWLFLFASIQAIGVLLTFFRVDIRFLRSQMTVAPPREKVMVFFAMCSILLSGYGFYRQSGLKSVPEFDDPQNALILGWGGGAGLCQIKANGERLWSYRSHYKLAIGCYAYDGLGNLLDSPQLQVGNLYDIGHGQVNLIVKWGAGFADYLNKKNAIGLHHALLMVPNGIEITQFNTLRQARALGVRIIFDGVAMSLPPPS